MNERITQTACPHCGAPTTGGDAAPWCSDLCAEMAAAYLTPARPYDPQEQAARTITAAKERMANADALALKAEAINDIADVLALPTGSTAKDAVEGVRRLAADIPKALGMLVALTTERDALRGELNHMCHGVLCGTCKKSPADSHDGCRLRAAESLANSAESSERRAYDQLRQAQREKAEAEERRNKAQEETRRALAELQAYERDPFLIELRKERDAALAQVKLWRDAHGRLPLPAGPKP